MQHAFGKNLAFITGLASDLEYGFVTRDRSGVHDWAPIVCKARMMALRRRGTLNALPPRGLASTIASSAAARNACCVAARPISAASLRPSRQGKGATPPA